MSHQHEHNNEEAKAQAGDLAEVNTTELTLDQMQNMLARLCGQRDATKDAIAALKKSIQRKVGAL